MLKQFKTKAKLLGLVAASVFTCGAQADYIEKGFTISPMFGGYFPGHESSLEDGAFGSIGLGYDFSKPWGVEFSYVGASAEVTGFPESEVTLGLVRGDLLFYFREEQFQPYMVLGLATGQFEDDAGSTESDTSINLGLGAKYYITKSFALRTDVRIMKIGDNSESDVLAGVGAVFKFGHSGSSTPKYIPPAAPKDSDNDGVIDSDDRCPGTAAGVVVDSKGCKAVIDSDGDGVVDALDQCPDSEAGSKVDEKGCYQILKEDVSVTLFVNFATNSANVLANSYDDIEQLAKFLKSYPLAEAVIEGHTDSMGAAAYNKSLSQKRADAVVAILVSQYGADATRLTAIGYGEEQPLVDNFSPENRAKNRRVTAVVSATVEKTIK